MTRAILTVMLATVCGTPLLAQTSPTPAPVPAAAPAPIKSTLKPVPTDTSLPRQKLVTVFGTDQCPKSDDPDEIIICTRRPDDERFRIPPTVRTDSKPAGPFEGPNRKALLGDASGGAGGGIGSCSAVGPGGGTGCNQAMQDEYRAARKAGEVPQSQLPTIPPF